MINWKTVQTRLKVTPDGIVGPQTLKGLLDAITHQKVPLEVAKALLAVLDRADLDTPNRLASFIAQTAHESANYKFRAENLNYSAKGLRSVFGKYFKTDALAAAYQRKPEAIANVVYANRMGNGNTASGDGWKFRGKGYIQLTGRENWEAFSQWTDVSINDSLDLADSVEGAMLTAVFFWERTKLNSYADKDNILGQTKAINGGLNGIAERKEMYERGKALLA